MLQTKSNFGEELTLEFINELQGVSNGYVDNERFGPELTWIEIIELIQPPTRVYVGWWTNDRMRQIHRDVQVGNYWTLIDGRVFIIRYRSDGRFLVKSIHTLTPCALFYNNVFEKLPEVIDANTTNSSQS